MHAAFFFGALMSGVALVAAAMVIPSSRASGRRGLDINGGGARRRRTRSRCCWRSARASEWGWGSPAIIALFVVAAVILAVWARLQLRRAAPLVDLRQLRHRAVLTADLAAILLGVAMYMFLTVVTEFVQVPRSVGFGFGASTLVAGLCLVPFSVMSLLASRTAGALLRSALRPAALLIGGSLMVAVAGVFFALLHGALWQAFVTMGVIGIGFGLTFAAIPGMIARAVARRETGSAMGLYQVIRYIGFSVGSALAASILAGNLMNGGQVAQRGYIEALWVGAAICAVSAAASWVLSRGGEPVSPQALGPAERERLVLADAELAGAGLVGIEHEQE